ncbi:MAG: apolipoprotein N-acyltransferase [Candidatus Omnitrophica bacterium]|nr:apolipoprotein N-acyltransferase [Candidatus Omnitrophota bacterium]
MLWKVMVFVRKCIGARVHRCAWGQVVKDVLLCALSAVLLALSFPNFDIEILSWFGFIPLFFVLKNKPLLKSFFLAYFTGLIFWFGTIYWLIHVTLAGLIILVFYLSLYFAVFGLIFSLFTRYAIRNAQYHSPIYFLFLPAAWVILEYARSYIFTGFPWIPLGYSQYMSLPVIQIADITGVWGVSFLVMLANTTVYSIADSRLSVHGSRCAAHSVIKGIAIPIVILGLSFSYGYYRLNQYRGSENSLPETGHRAAREISISSPSREVRTTGSKLRISVIQGNIPQEMKWDKLSGEHIIDTYMGLTSDALLESPDLVIWPEAAFPFVLKRENSYSPFPILVEKFEKPLLAGAVISDRLQYYNGVLMISGKGRVVNSYRKIHLVPFGEYIPLRGILGFLETVVPIGDFIPGTEHTVFELSRDSGGGVRFGVLICFEDAFPLLSCRLKRGGADFLVNMTNDAWFRKTSSPYQHLSASVFRAVENRVPVVRAANTGVSGFIAPTGGIISLVQDKQGERVFIGGIKTGTITLDKRQLSFYARYGDVFVVFCGIFLILGIFVCRTEVVLKEKKWSLTG